MLVSVEMRAAGRVGLRGRDLKLTKRCFTFCGGEGLSL